MRVLLKSPCPNSGCRPTGVSPVSRSRLRKSMYWSDSGSSGAALMSRFHSLSAVKGRLPFRLAPMPVEGAGTGLGREQGREPVRRVAAGAVGLLAAVVDRQLAAHLLRVVVRLGE